MIDHSYAWSLTNAERFEVMASPNKCLHVVRQLRDNPASRYFCKGCGVDVTGPMWCGCGEFVLLGG